MKIFLSKLNFHLFALSSEDFKIFMTKSSGKSITDINKIITPIAYGSIRGQTRTIAVGFYTVAVNINPHGHTERIPAGTCP